MIDEDTLVKIAKQNGIEFSLQGGVAYTMTTKTLVGFANAVLNYQNSKHEDLLTQEEFDLIKEVML